MEVTDRQRTRRRLLPEMEGRTARWYARNRGSAAQRAEYRTQAAALTERLPDEARVLEVAPGPGYLAIEIARRGRYHVTGVDISRTMVEIARENARQAGVHVDFQQGDAARLPFDADSFDLIVCQAAFKNFTQPVAALDDMQRVLRRGGTTVIHDLRRDASAADIDQAVRGMGLGPLNSFVVKGTLSWLRRRAATAAHFTGLVSESAFHTCDIRSDGISMEVYLKKV